MLAPATEQGWVVWRAAATCLRGGWGGAELDTAAALALATAQGVAPAVAAELLAAFAAGMHEGAAARRQADETSPPPAGAA